MASEKKQYQQINPSVLLDAAGNDLEVFRDLSATFLEIAPAILSRLQQAIGEGNIANVTLESHSLKGTVALVGATQLTALLAQIEALSRSAAIDQIKPMLNDVSARYIATEAEVRQSIIDFQIQPDQADTIKPD